MSRPRRQPRREINGVLLLDKPSGISSNDAMMAVRRLFNAEKAGHTGTLDPLATGLLPICFGQATKLSSHLLDARKRYLAEVRLGARTTTGDAEGEVTARSEPAGLALADLQKAAAACTGVIQQVPPMYSAIKQGGARLYELAREGVEVERSPRTVEIHALRVLSADGATAMLDVTCSKGTYIRTLAEDWAAHLGQVAHLSGLRRIAVGLYGMDAPAVMITMAEMEALSTQDALDRHLLPTRSMLADWPQVDVDAESAVKMDRGMRVAHDAPPGWAVINGPEGQFLGIGELLPEGFLQPRRWFGLDGV